MRIFLIGPLSSLLIDSNQNPPTPAHAHRPVSPTQVGPTNPHLTRRVQGRVCRSSRLSDRSVAIEPNQNPPALAGALPPIALQPVGSPVLRPHLPRRV